MKEHKLGVSANLICSFIVIIVYAVIINTSGHLDKNPVVFLDLYLAVDVVALIIGVLSMDINPIIPKSVIALMYASMCAVSLLVNGSNYMMFQLMMLSLGAVSLFMSKVLFNLSMFLDVIIAIFAWLIPIPNVVYVYNIRDYLLNLLCLVIEYVILYVVQTILSEREATSAESQKTVEELIRVIDAKREEAFYASRAKSDFLANMSHEIRTPINAVLGFNEMIIRENRDPNVNEFALDIRSSGNSLLALVNDILDFSKIEAGKMEIVPVTYDLSSMLNDLINIISFRAIDKGLNFEVDVDPAMPHLLYGDEIRIRQVITNILTNAVKYTDEGYINLRVDYKQTDDYQVDLYVEVSDTGRGIKPEDIEKLYTPFERLDVTQNRYVEGTGLGIPLTRTLLNLMGSSLEIDSTYGVGSTFSFELRQEVENWEPLGALDEALKRAKASNTAEKHDYFIAPSARILAVDDMPINLRVFEALLKRTQIRIDTASGGIEALAMMRKAKYDVIFLDHMMPDVDGIETLERMKDDRFNVNRFDTPVIALTANAISGARELYMDKGFEDYLTKPIDSDRIEAMLIKYLDPSLITYIKEDTKERDVSGLENDDTAKTDNGDVIISKLLEIDMLDVNMGIETSGGMDIYKQVVRDYASTMDTYLTRIENFYNERDIDNYRIQVHGLKSTSRLAGAHKISEMARQLEVAAERRDLEYIQKYTTALLSSYRNLCERLSEIFGEQTSHTSDERPEIEPEMLKEAFMTMKEAVDSFDQDLIESVMSQLEEYKLPEDFTDVFDRIKLLFAEVAMDDLAKILDEWIGKI